MGKFSDVLLTVDFDRTLTAPDSTIPKRNMEAIEYFMAEGGAFTVNTGRSIPMYSSLMDVIPVNAPLLLYNGSAAYDKDKGELTFCTPIDLDWRETIRHTRELFPDLTVEFQGTKAHYIFDPDEKWRDFCVHNGCPWGFAGLEDDLGVFLKFSIYGKITKPTVAHLYEGTPEEIARIDQVQRLVQAEFGEKVTVFRAANRIIDVHAAGVGKDKSALRLKQELGRKILVCAGDADNDISMMEAADYAYSPADGIIAGRYETVCPCAEGAVADVIYKKIPEILEGRA